MTTFEWPRPCAIPRTTSGYGRKAQFNVTDERQSSGAWRVVAPARLHLGFLDIDGTLGRRFGSIGLAVDEPATELVVRRAEAPSASGPEQERVLKLIRLYDADLGLGSGYAVDVTRAIPAHAGLGSGTQLALAVGAGLLKLSDRPDAIRRVGELAERGARSAIGMAAFETGGFVIDGGKGKSGRAPPVLARVAFPDDWRVLLILDHAHEGVSGDNETKAFAALPPFPEALAARLCHLALMRLLPGLAESDLVAFGDALTEIQAVVGGHFATAQGGSPWTSPAVGRLASRMKELGAAGIGQSSWGPTGFAFTGSEAAAARLYATLVEEAKAEGLEIRIVRGRNSGASLVPAQDSVHYKSSTKSNV